MKKILSFLAEMFFYTCSSIILSRILPLRGKPPITYQEVLDTLPFIIILALLMTVLRRFLSKMGIK